MSRFPFVVALAAFALTVAAGVSLARAAEGPDEAAAARKQTWLASEFRCRAISSMKLRTCRFVQEGERVTLSFPQSDIACAVEFDEHGDPGELVDCRAGWLKIPKRAPLKRAKKRPVWSGSHSGWTWPDSGEEYCCPGMWIVAPKALQGGR